VNTGGRPFILHAYPSHKHMVVVVVVVELQAGAEDVG